MSAFPRAFLLLCAVIACADSEPRDRDDDDERSRAVNPPIVEWLEEIGLKFLGESTFSKPSLTLILGLTRAGALASVGLHDLPELP